MASWGIVLVPEENNLRPYGGEDCEGEGFNGVTEVACCVKNGTALCGCCEGKSLWGLLCRETWPPFPRARDPLLKVENCLLLGESGGRYDQEECDDGYRRAKHKRILAHIPPFLRSNLWHRGIVPKMDGFYHNRNITAAFTLVCLFLVPLLVYFPVLRSDYVAYDDELLLVDNVKAQGVTWENVKQAFTTYDPELYIPLTILSYQVEYSIIGWWNSAVSHGVSLAIHLMNVLLVYWLMRLLLQNSPFAAFAVALLWAIHPLNVEAVAWAAARKDLLSGFFFLCTLILYLRSLRLTSYVSFLLGLLAKVSIAPLPLVLFLLEWFIHPLLFKGEGRVRVLRRISPYFLLSLLFVVIALLGKKAQVHTLGTTLLAPFIAIPFYLQKLFIPTGLSILYPFTEDLSLAHPSVLLGILVVGGIAGLVWWSLRWTRSIACALGIFLLLLAPSFLNVARRGDGGIIDLVKIGRAHV